MLRTSVKLNLRIFVKLKRAEVERLRRGGQLQLTSNVFDLDARTFNQFDFAEVVELTWCVTSSEQLKELFACIDVSDQREVRVDVRSKDKAVVALVFGIVVAQRTTCADRSPRREASDGRSATTVVSTFSDRGVVSVEQELNQCVVRST